MATFDDFEADIRAMAAEADHELALTCKRAVQNAADAAVAEAKATKKYTDRSADGLTKSIGGRVTSAGPTSAEGVFEATAQHALWVDEGTKPHVIRPKNSPYLVFAGRDGRNVFAREVNHPGTKPDGFFERGVNVIEGMVESEVDGGMARVGAAFNK